MKAAAIILAAGESRRMGRPKALLPFRGGTFLSELAATLSRHCDPVMAVFGAGAETLAAQAPVSVRVVNNENYRQGMLTSLQAGLRELGPGPFDAVLFTLVDHPAIAAETVGALLAANAPIAIPRFEGRRGHPVVLRGAMVSEVRAEPASSKIHDIIDRHAGEIAYVDVNDPGIRDDVDDPERYRELMSRQVQGV